MTLKKTIGYLSAAACAVALLVACGGGGGGGAAPTATVSVTVSGLDAAGLVLQNNAGDTLAVAANGVSTFATALAAGAAYSVSVLTQPGAPSQFCSVTNGSGVVTTGNVINIAVACTDVARFAYVANGDDSITRYTLDATTGAISGTSLQGGLFNGTSVMTALAADPQGRFVFLLDSHDAFVISDQIDRSTGDIAVLAGFANTDASPTAIAVRPDGKFLYVAASSGGGVVAAYSIAADGTLALIAAPAGVATGNNPTAITIDPAGKFLYASNTDDGTVTAFSIDAATGRLTNAGGVSIAPHAPAVTSTALALDPLGRSMYVVDNTNFLLRGSPINAATGRPSATAFESSTAAIGAGNGPSSLAMDPLGRFAYVASTLPGQIAAFALDPATGGLAAGPAITATAVNAVVMDPTGRFLYSANAAQSASAYAVDPTSGALTQIGANASAGAHPKAIALSK